MSAACSTVIIILLQTPSSGDSKRVIVGVVREELDGISDNQAGHIELTEGDTASKGLQSLPDITAVNRGALSCDSREVQKALNAFLGQNCRTCT